MISKERRSIVQSKVEHNIIVQCSAYYNTPKCSVVEWSVVQCSPSGNVDCIKEQQRHGRSHFLYPALTVVEIVAEELFKVEETCIQIFCSRTWYYSH